MSPNSTIFHSDPDFPLCQHAGAVHSLQAFPPPHRTKGEHRRDGDGRACPLSRPSPQGTPAGPPLSHPAPPVQPALRRTSRGHGVAAGGGCWGERPCRSAAFLPEGLQSQILYVLRLPSFKLPLHVSRVADHLCLQDTCPVGHLTLPRNFYIE